MSRRRPCSDSYVSGIRCGVFELFVLGTDYEVPLRADSEGRGR